MTRPTKKRFAGAKLTSKPKQLSRDSLVRQGFLENFPKLPLVIEPSIERLDLAQWVVAEREELDVLLRNHGAILFRGFDISTVDRFDRYLEVTSADLMQYLEGATPRTELREKIYTSTEFPADQHIHVHNELSYRATFPERVWFVCVTPADEGGETPIADVREVYRRIDESILREFEHKNWMLLRNYREGVGLRWQDVFHLDDRRAVEESCARSGIQCEWRGDDHLRTSQSRSPTLIHPTTGEPLWFNHIAFWHVSSLPASIREGLLGNSSDSEAPFNTYFGDGSTIPDSVVEHLRAAYDDVTVAFPWERGDIMMLDNLSVAHGRRPFKGERRILAAMGEPFTRTEP